MVGMGPPLRSPVDRHKEALPVLTPEQRAQLRFDDRGLIPAIVQQHDTGEVLMMAWMDETAIATTLNSGSATYFSRSRQKHWRKGETSGNTQRIVTIRVDCDGDVLLLLVDQEGDGVACHTGERSCFHRSLSGAPEGHAASAPPLATSTEGES